MMQQLELVTTLQPHKVKSVRAALLAKGIHSLLEPIGRGFNLWVVDQDLNAAMATCWETELELLRDWDGNYGDR
jgi:hypothetical protein